MNRRFCTEDMLEAQPLANRLRSASLCRTRTPPPRGPASAAAPSAPTCPLSSVPCPLVGWCPLPGRLSRPPPHAAHLLRGRPRLPDSGRRGPAPWTGHMTPGHPLGTCPHGCQQVFTADPQVLPCPWLPLPPRSRGHPSALPTPDAVIHSSHVVHLLLCGRRRILRDVKMERWLDLSSRVYSPDLVAAAVHMIPRRLQSGTGG